MSLSNYISYKVNNYILFEQYSSLAFLRDSSIRHAFTKGAVLSQRCYNAPYSRGIGDIDILVPPLALNKMESLLKANGFKECINNETTNRFSRVFLLSNSHQVIPYFKKLVHSSVIVDINFDVMWGEYEGIKIDMDDFLSDTVCINICGSTIHTLTTIKSFVHLILHHYKDMNSIYILATRNSINRNMFRDIYSFFMNNLESLQFKQLYDLCYDYKITPYMFYMFYYLGQLYDDDLIKYYTDGFRTEEGITLLDCYGLCAQERKKWKYSFKTRLETDNLLSLIQDDLTDKDLEKIRINNFVFGR